MKTEKERPRANHHRQGWRLLLGAAFFGVFVYLALPTPACGPFFPDAIFTRQSRPDGSLENFAAGKLGILTPTFEPAYLFIAYRNLAGAPLSERERKQFVDSWSAHNYLEDGPEPPPSATPIQRWTQARKDAGAAFRSRDLYEYLGQDFVEADMTVGQTYIFYANCLGDAFDRAAATLEERKKRFGPQSDELKAWLDAQDMVFSNCRGASDDRVRPQKAFTPPEAKESDPPLVRRDRAYQIAAAHFYRGDFDKARQEFQAIAADADSPWNHTAELLVARALLRKATLAVPTDDAALALAGAQLQKVAADPQCPEMHAAAHRLLNFVAARLHGESRLRELSDAIAKRDASPDFSQDLTDYIWLLGHDPAREPKETDPEPVRWFDAFSIKTPEENAHAIARWKAQHSTEWLVAALAGATSSTPELAQLLDAAQKVPAASPAFATASFHRVRLLVAAGREDEARQALDNLLAVDDGPFPPSSRNQLLALRLRLARNLDEFSRFAPRVPAEVSYYWNAHEDEALAKWVAGRPAGRPMPASFDADSVWIMRGYFPTSTLVRAAQAAKLPRRLQRDLALSTWVRAELLDQKDQASALRPIIEDLFSDLKAALEEQKADEQKKPGDAAARKFGVAFLMLHQPGLHAYVSGGVGRTEPLNEIDSYRDNWWCPLASDNMPQLPWYLVSILGTHQPQAPGFLSDDEQRQAKDEAARLKEILSGPVYLSKIVIDWAKAHPDDPRVPEALHLAVRSTRYGCRDAWTSEYSKTAFQLLHSRYPHSEWTAKTKYWF